MEPNFKRDIENGKYKNEDPIASLIPYMLDGVTYALALDATPSLRKHIAAAIFKYKNPADCYEDILDAIDVEGYSDENSYSSSDMIIHLIVEHATMTSLMLSNYNAWCLGATGGLSKGLFIAGMIRIVSGFKSAAILLRHGFYVEVSSIFRMILEQLAWGCYLIKEKDETKIPKNRTQSNISYLKDVLGNDVGQLYGQLSSEAHLEPNEIGKYLNIKGEQLQIKSRSGEKCKEEVINLLVLLKFYGRVVWFGIKHFGIPDKYTNYFCDWDEFDRLQIQCLREAINGKIRLVREHTAMD